MVILLFVVTQTQSTPQAPAKPRSSLVKKLAMLAVSALVTAGVAEWAVRALNIERLPATNPDLYQPDDELVFTMKPNVTMYSHGCEIETNRAGLRGPHWEDVHAQDRQTVMFLGDSVTVGFGVRYEECFVSRFSERNDRDLTGVCLGLCGYNYEQEFGLAKRHLTDIRPAATVVTFVGNDFEEPYAIFERRVTPNHEAGLLEPVKELLRSNSALYAFLRKRYRKLRHGGSTSDGHETWVGEELAGDTPESLAHYEAYERGLREIMDATQAPLVLVLFPLGVPDECTTRLKEIAERTGAHWVDLSKLWDNIPEYLVTDSLGWDGHPAAHAHDKIATEILTAIDEVLPR